MTSCLHSLPPEFDRRRLMPTQILHRDQGLAPAVVVAPAQVTRVLLWSIAGFTAVIIAWASVAEVNETATAPGRVVPTRPLQVVSNLEGGIVSAILVKPGQVVAAGAPLLRLDPASVAADYGRTSAAGNALAARIVRLEAEVTNRVPAFPPALEAAAPAAVAAERSAWAARRLDRASSIAGSRARVAAAGRGLDEAQAAAAAAAEARAQAAREVAVLVPLVDKGIEPRLMLDRARSALVQADAAAAGARQAVARAAAIADEASAAVANIADGARAAAGNELALARAEFATQSAALPALRNRVERTAVRSPMAGTVQRVIAGTVGGSVAPGAPLVEIVPAGGALAVEARVRPRDIGMVHIGQPASVRITAFDSSLYGKLDGRVTRISPDAVSDDRGGEGWYLVRVETRGDGLVGPDGRKHALGAGMVAEADLLGPSRTVMSYLLSPITRLSATAFRER
jgi:adhesin transport system membrane fusion protein